MAGMKEATQAVMHNLLLAIVRQVYVDRECVAVRHMCGAATFPDFSTRRTALVATRSYLKERRTGHVF